MTRPPYAVRNWQVRQCCFHLEHAFRLNPLPAPVWIASGRVAQTRQPVWSCNLNSPKGGQGKAACQSVDHRCNSITLGVAPVGDPGEGRFRFAEVLERRRLRVSSSLPGAGTKLLRGWRSQAKNHIGVVGTDALAPSQIHRYSGGHLAKHAHLVRSDSRPGSTASPYSQTGTKTREGCVDARASPGARVSNIRVDPRGRVTCSRFLSA